MLEVGREKVKIGDEQNRQALRNVDPKEPFHGMGLAAIDCLGQELELISQMRLPCAVLVSGVAGGVSIFVCYAAAFLITDRTTS